MALYGDQHEIERRWNPYASAVEQQSARSTFLNGVYQHMAIGLGVTGLVAMMTARSEAAMATVAAHPFLLIIAQIGLVLALSGLINRLSTPMAVVMFYLYSAITGLMLSMIFLAYTSESLASTFFITGGTFAVMSVIGYTTKRDLTGMGTFLLMGLIGIIIASVVNIWLRSDTLIWVTSCIGVLIFVGLTAYDTQKIKRLAYQVAGQEGAGRIAILGALTLYLDFINLFLFLLRFTGSRRRD